VNDHLGLFDTSGDEDTGNVDVSELRRALARRTTAPETPAPEPARLPRREAMRAKREALAKRKRRRRRSTLIAVVVLLVIVGGMAGGFLLWRHNVQADADYSGAPGGQLIVRVQSGDTRDDIATTLADRGVVASSQAFLDATANDADVANLQPGYFRVQSHLPASAAANQLVDPANRVGHLKIVPGQQLNDITGQNGAVIAGYLSQITAAACVPLDGKQQNCFTVADLTDAASTADLGDLDLPEWAQSDVKAAPIAKFRLEGMILPGEYDIPPNGTALDTLQAVLHASTAKWSGTGVSNAEALAGLTPYQAVVIASIAEREAGAAADMPKVARVVDNRLQGRDQLQLDSTVSYAVGHAAIYTTAAERKSDSPYNTYVQYGLPPTPIAGIGPDALEAALNPADGSWKYFVAIGDGKTCFTDTLKEQQAAADARKCAA
jgi:UPF0755 protein